MTLLVYPCTRKQAEQFVLTKHYSRRASIFWEGFCLVENGKIVGVVVYGQPSPSIQKHAFSNRNFRLYELSRLVIQTKTKNAASILVGKSLSMLKEQPSAVVSYADTEMGHSGIVYQATNWIYTGSSKSHDSMYIIDGERVHPMTLRDRGITNPKKWAIENNISTAPPFPKHRYFYINGSKSQKKYILKLLQYPIITPYPKSDKTMYDDGEILDVNYGLNSSLFEWGDSSTSNC